jgi:hypothetical protein
MYLLIARDNARPHKSLIPPAEKPMTSLIVLSSKNAGWLRASRAHATRSNIKKIANRFNKYSPMVPVTDDGIDSLEWAQ